MELTIAYYGRHLNDDDESMTSLRNESSMLRGYRENKCPYFELDDPEMLKKVLEKRLT